MAVFPLVDRLRAFLSGSAPSAGVGGPRERIDRVAPWLHTGPVLTAHMLDSLAGRGITYVLDLRDEGSDDQPVYAHCLAGLVRTPTVAIALLMQRDLPLADARRLVFAARPEISPTESQMAWLEVLEARRRTTDHGPRD